MKLNLNHTIITAQSANSNLTKVYIVWDKDTTVLRNILDLVESVQKEIEAHPSFGTLNTTLKYSAWYSDFDLNCLDRICGQQIPKFQTGKYISQDGAVVIDLSSMDGRGVDMLDVSFPLSHSHTLFDLLDNHVPRHTRCMFQIQIGRCVFIIGN